MISLEMVATMRAGADGQWMKQIAHNVTMEGCGALRDCRFLLRSLVRRKALPIYLIGTEGMAKVQYYRRPFIPSN